MDVQSRRERNENPVHGVLVTGLVVDPDGRTVWVGSEGGVFELKVNLAVRRGFPGMEMR